MDVRLTDPSRAHLMAFFVRSLLEKRLKDPEVSRRAAAIQGRFSLEGSGMRAVLSFAPAGIEITCGEGPADAGVRGELPTLLGVCLGKGYVLPVLLGRLGLRGNPIRLLPLLKVLVG